MYLNVTLLRGLELGTFVSYATLANCYTNVTLQEKNWYYLTYIDVNLFKSTHC